MPRMTAQTNATLEVAVIGVGRMGRHHARTYHKLPQAKLVAVVDPDLDRAGTVADDYDCDAFASIDELLAAYPNLAAATVAVPTVAHVAMAQPLLERKVACLVEKPLAPTPEQAKQLAELAKKVGVALQVGHTERFNPAVRTIAGLKLRPRFMEVIRVSPMTFRSLDVGVVMDIMIHDLDIVMMLDGSPLEQVEAVGVAVLGQHEDICNARLTFASGCVANITASRLALKTERRLRLFSEEAYVNLDYQHRTGVVIRKSANEATLDEVRQQIATGTDLSTLDYSKLVAIEELRMDVPAGEEDPLTAQLTSFLNAVARGVPPAVDGEAGQAAVAAAQRVVQAVRAHHWVGLGDNPAR